MDLSIHVNDPQPIQVRFDMTSCHFLTLILHFDELHFFDLFVLYCFPFSILTCDLYILSSSMMTNYDYSYLLNAIL